MQKEVAELLHIRKHLSIPQVIALIEQEIALEVNQNYRYYDAQAFYQWYTRVGL